MEATKYQIRLENFEGPLDLLLHLIEKNELDIYDIPIAQITDQYLDYVNEAKNFDLDIASEFLVMAATLLAIKAKMLLPKPPKLDNEGLEEDPREELVARLIEYKQYKQAAQYLQEKEKDMSNIFVRDIDESMIIKDFQPVNPVSNVSLQDLLKHFKGILDRASELVPVFELEKEEIAITQCMAWVLDGLSAQPQGLSFKELFPKGATRLHLVMTFLALLELIKQNKIRCRQDRVFGDIQIFLSENYPI